jgi:uncharacterized repeat protein (TIGR01451 family)
MCAWLVGLALTAGMVADPASGSASAGRGVWAHVKGSIPNKHHGHRRAIKAKHFRAFKLQRAAIASALAQAPAESSAEADPALTIAIPAPNGGFERFAVRESPVMEPKLAAKYPRIRTYAGEGISDPTATIRISVTPLGFQASVRGRQGSWYIDPYYRGLKRVYVSYLANALKNSHGRFQEAPESSAPGAIFGRPAALANRLPTTDAGVFTATGDQLRIYRLALASDPTYATYFGGSANVTAAKVALINRVTQIYEDEVSIRLVLIGNNNLLNLDTAAQATGANGPCGTAACFTAAQLSSCAAANGVTTRNRIVIGQIIGASNYDIGHIVLGQNGGGFAPGRVGQSTKAGGCTGTTNPVGDAFAVDYVAHEMGHQFSARHTWNGDTNPSCGPGQFTAGSAVEPGSGSSIMSYAGICGDDNLQTNSDPHFSQLSHEQIANYTASTIPNENEVQTASLRNFDGTESFRLTYGGGAPSVAITRGTTYNAAGITAALAGILPAGATVAVADFGGGGAPSDNGFEVTFGGTLAGVDAQALGVTGATGDASGFVGETDQGGPPDNSGNQVVSTGNSFPSVSTPTSFTIPYRTPFKLTGSATDADGDALTYSWEQNDPSPTQVNLTSPTKTAGPLFRQFSTALNSAAYTGTNYNTGGFNHPTTDPSRTFPDLPQIVANNTNADTGDCPSGTTAQRVDCYSEFLPTAGYAGPMHFRFTARDNSSGGGGVNDSDTTVNLAPGTGPFKVTAPNTAGVTWVANKNATVTWDVAGTTAAPISTANVDILLSTDGGTTFSQTLASNTANDGSEQITVPDVNTTQARVMVRAVGNIFFDISNADFRIDNTADMELVSKADSQDPAYAGETLTYTITARNNGPAKAENARVVDVLPSGTSYQSSSIPCAESPAGTLTCGLGDLDDDESRTFTITVFIARDLVYNNGAPKTITNTATADSNRDDPTPGNDQKSESTLVKAKADLKIVSFNPVGPPVELIVGQPQTVTLRKVITNAGPSAPMDVRVNRGAAATSNATVTPTASSSVAAALGYQEQRTLDEQFQVACTGPGQATFTFTNAISPDRPDDIDPDPTNNTKTVAFTVTCIVPVALNIHPGSFTNPINLKSNGVIPTAVLTTRAGEYGLPLAFDASEIQPLTVRFGPKPVVTAGGGAPESHGKGHIEDAIEKSDEKTKDGDLDMVLHFDTQRSQLTGTETEACVRGRFGPNDYVFQGCDKVTFVPN